MKRLRTLRSTGLVLCCVALVAACSPPPETGGPAPTDLYLLDIWADRGLVSVGVPRNLTARPGWDNQPGFTRDGDAVLYASKRGERVDVWRYDAGAAEPVTVSDRLSWQPEPSVQALEIEVPSLFVVR